MIRALRYRFTLAVMSAFLAVLLMLLVCLNGVYRQRVYADIDRRLMYLAESAIGPAQGMIDVTPEQMRRWIDLNDAGIMNETSYFIFSGFMTLDVREASTARLTLALGQDAHAVMRGILGGTRDFGNVGAYRFYCAERTDPYKLVFLRCESEFDAMRSLLTSSIAVGAGFFLAVLLSVLALSGRVLRPFAENIESQKRFISNASHELKTPLGVIVSDLDMQVLENGSSEWLENAQLQADHLSRLIDRLTAYSLLEERRRRADAIPVDLSALAESLAVEFGPLARARSLALHAEVAPALYVRGSADDFRMLLSVLLENAVKYTPEGGSIALRLTRRKHARLEVENTCAPLEEERLDRLFERFYRSPEHRTDRGGSGLGLSIAREITQLYGGAIRAARTDAGALIIQAELPLCPGEGKA